MAVASGQYSDDSDSEIFRVKRRSATKIEKRSTGGNVVKAGTYEEQVNLKQCKLTVSSSVLANMSI